MIPDDKIAFFARHFNNISIEDIAGLFGNATKRYLKQGDIYINHYSYNRNLAYINQGIIRCFSIKNNGEEATLLFRWEDQFVGSHDCIILQRSSNFTYQALEDTSLLEIDYAEIETIMKNNPKYEPLRNFILMSMLSESLKTLENFILLSPEERYLKLISENFDIVNRVPDKYIASMLGITPVTLSRIRKRISSKKGL